jgi:hypothetical protein
MGGGVGPDDGAAADEGPGLGLDQVLAALRRDLVAARDEAQGEGYGLGVSEVEVELSVEVSRSVEGKASGGVKWFVLSGDVSGGGSRDRSQAHRIKLTLRPQGGGEVTGGQIAEAPADTGGADATGGAATPESPAGGLAEGRGASPIES